MPLRKEQTLEMGRNGKRDLRTARIVQDSRVGGTASSAPLVREKAALFPQETGVDGHSAPSPLGDGHCHR